MSFSRNIGLVVAAAAMAIVVGATIAWCLHSGQALGEASGLVHAARDAAGPVARALANWMEPGSVQQYLSEVLSAR